MWRSTSLRSRTFDRTRNTKRCSVNTHRLHLRHNSTNANDPIKPNPVRIVAVVALSAPLGLLLYSKQHPDWNPPLLHKYDFWKRIHNTMHSHHNAVPSRAIDDTKRPQNDASLIGRNTVSERPKEAGKSLVHAAETEMEVSGSMGSGESTPDDPTISDSDTDQPVASTEEEDPTGKVTKLHGDNKAHGDTAVEEKIDQKRQEIDLLTQNDTTSVEVSEPYEDNKIAQDSVVEEMIDQKRQEIDVLTNLVTPSVLLEATVDEIKAIKVRYVSLTYLHAFSIANHAHRIP